jgi:transporter family-2 protein
MGAATFLALLFTGQMLGSIIFDHFGWLGLTQRPVDARRLLGIALFIEGVVLIRR